MSYSEDTMTDGPETFTIEHLEAPQFRTIYAAGAVFSGPIDPPKHWILTFYSEGAMIVSETLIKSKFPGAYELADPPQIETHRVRRDEVCITISEFQLRALIEAIAKSMQASPT
jgi:hypothetical protein